MNLIEAIPVYGEAVGFGFGGTDSGEYQSQISIPLVVSPGRTSNARVVWSLHSADKPQGTARE